MLRGNIAQRFRHRLRTEQGRRFFGHVEEFPTTLRTDDLMAPRRLLYVDPKTGLRPGETIVLADGTSWLCSLHGGSDRLDVFKLFRVTHYFSWRRQGTTVDFVTNLEREDGIMDLGTIAVALEPTGQVSDIFRAEAPVYKALTGAPLLRHDRLDIYEVITAEYLLGITVATVQ